MFVLKSGLGAKVALAALGLILGVGGVAAGARLHAPHTNQGNRRVFAAQILGVEHGSGGRNTFLHVVTRSGLSLILVVTPQTAIRFNGHTAPEADLQVGAHIIGQVRYVRNDLVYVATITITWRAPHAAQGP